MRKSKNRIDLSPIIVALCFGLMAAVSFVYIVWRGQFDLKKDEFHANTRLVRQHITDKLSSSEECIFNLETLFNTFMEVNSDQFRFYTLENLARLDYIESVYYSPLIPDAMKGEFETMIRDKGIPTFHIFKNNDGINLAEAPTQYLPVRYIEPQTPINTGLIGYDFFSDIDFQEYILKAIDTAKPVAFPAAKLGEKKQGVYLIKSIYEAPSAPLNIQDRQEIFSGLLAFYLDPLIILRDLPEADDYSVNLLKNEDGSFSSPVSIAEFKGTQFEPRMSIKLRMFKSTEEIRFGGMSLQLVIQQPFIWRDVEWSLVVATLIFGVIITVLLVLMARNRVMRAFELQRRNEEIRDVVKSRTTELALEKSSLEHEMSERRKTENALAKLSRALHQTADSVIITDPDGIIEYVNSAFEKMTGFRTVEVIGREANILKSGKHDDAFYKILWDTIKRGDDYQAVLINKRKDGTLYYEEKTITPLKNEKGKIINFVSTGKDITSRMETQERLNFLAHHDALTKLANIALFKERLEQSIKLSKRNSMRPAVLFIDLDRFKAINDTMGHDAGDSVLRKIAKRLVESVRESDTVARRGGDEFTILLQDVMNTFSVVRICERILKIMTKKMIISGQDIYLTASIGAAFYPQDGENVQELMNSADTAMYRAKESGKNTFQFYSSEMSAQGLELIKMEGRLRQALDNKEFLLHYQPIVDIWKNEIFGVEALIRWNHSERGILEAEEFIEMLNDTGLIVSVGDWVIRNACEQQVAWRQQGLKPVIMSINLSMRQFIQPNLVKTVEKILMDTKIRPKHLNFEIVENFIMNNLKVGLERIAGLRALGIQFSLDDFGTGYSSLNYLKKLPINYLKVDRSFVADIVFDNDDATIVKTIISVAHNLNVKVIAEGVENEDQREQLRKFSCDCYQGYYFSKPVPGEEITELLKQQAGSEGSYKEI